MGNTSAVTARNRFARQLFDPLPQRYDALAEVLSFGQNGRWRRSMLDRVVGSRPVRVLDVASGTAGVAIAAARRSQASVVAVDLNEAMLRRGAANVTAAGLGGRIRLVAGGAESLPFPDGAFDAVTFTYLLRYVDDPEATIGELARVLRPGGVMASLDFFVPPARFWRLWWWLYTRTVLPLAGWATGGRPWRTVGRFLGPNISAHNRRFPRAWIAGAWERAGFEAVGTRAMSLGGGLVMWGTRSGG